MTLTINKKVLQIVIPALVVLVSVLYVGLALERFVIAVVADPRIDVGQEMIEAAAEYFPNAASIQARLAARLVEVGSSQAEAHEQTAQRAVDCASRAVRLSPWQYENWLLLAASKELNGDLTEAEAALREALKRAPYHSYVRWLLANLLLREDKLDQAILEFQTVLAADPSRVPAILSLVWQASDSRVDRVRSVAGDTPKAKLALARFLARQDKVAEAAEVFRSIDRDAMRELIEESGKLIDELLAANEIEIAAELWRASADHAATASKNPSDRAGPDGLWNGGFEMPIRRELAQFDWQLGESDYAGIGLSAQARTGRRALKIAYLGKDTTKIDGEIKQRVLVRPGAQYRLGCYVKSSSLVTPGGPQIAVARLDSDTPIATSAPVEKGTHDWKLLSVDFIAPADAHVLMVSVRQIPQFSYVDQTKGTVWFDDFSLKAMP